MSASLDAATLFDQAPCGYLVTDAAGLVLQANTTVAEWVGLQRHRLVERTRFSQLLTPHAQQLWATRLLGSLIAHDRLNEGLLELACADGRRRPVIVTAATQRDGRGALLTLRLLLTPAAERTRYEDDLRRTRDGERAARQVLERLQRLTAALAATLEPAAIAALVLAESVAVARAVAGAVHLPGHPLTRHGPPPAAAAEQALIAAAAGGATVTNDGHHWVSPLRIDERTHGTLWLRTEQPIADEWDAHDQTALATYVSQGAQALERAHLFAELATLAGTDELTGLPNRRSWMSSAARAVAAADQTRSPLCVAIVDLDHFKRYNDSHGHPAGDRLLRTSAQGWRSTLREQDLLGRAGGEEFALLLPECALTCGLAQAERLRSATAPGITCSVGVAQWRPGDDLPQLIERADAALYRAKRAGRDRVAAAD